MNISVGGQIFEAIRCKCGTLIYDKDDMEAALARHRERHERLDNQHKAPSWDTILNKRARNRLAQARYWKSQARGAKKGGKGHRATGKRGAVESDVNINQARGKGMSSSKGSRRWRNKKAPHLEARRRV